MSTRASAGKARRRRARNSYGPSVYPRMGRVLIANFLSAKRPSPPAARKPKTSALTFSRKFMVFLRHQGRRREISTRKAPKRSVLLMSPHFASAGISELLQLSQVARAWISQESLRQCGFQDDWG